jgi:hypothetical protein
MDVCIEGTCVCVMFGPVTLFIYVQKKRTDNKHAMFEQVMILDTL